MCGIFVWYPRGWCTNCGSLELEWTKVSGKGIVYSLTAVRQVIRNSELYAQRLPIIIAMIDLDEGIRLVSALKNCDIKTVKIGMRVRVVFEQLDSNISFPFFEPEDEGPVEPSTA